MKEEVKNLLESVIRLFMKYGIKSVTMDDVAKELGISKKTIYQHFADRNNLVDAAMEYHLEYIQQNCAAIFDQSSDAVEQMLGIAEFMNAQMRNVNPTLLFDLKRYFPQSWKRINDHRVDFILQQVQANIQLGISQGYYRTDFNIQVVAHIYISIIDLILEGERLPKDEYSFKEIQQEFILYHLHAISTPKGIERISHLKSKENNS